MKYIFANWKMYLTLEESMRLTRELVAGYSQTSTVTAALFPTALATSSVTALCRGSAFAVGAQTCAWTPTGAYTGAISAHFFASAGCTYALVGHSERRHIFGETDSDVRRKIEACLDAGLTPVVCIGETKEEKDAGKREYRLKKQLLTAFDNLDLTGKDIMIAYEPVWAIGTGEACVPLDADDVHGWIRQELTQYTSAAIPILYGGSVDASNAKSFLELDTIDGVLVGSGSIKSDSFFSILKSA